MLSTCRLGSYFTSRLVASPLLPILASPLSPSPLNLRWHFYSSPPFEPGFIPRRWSRVYLVLVFSLELGKSLDVKIVLVASHSYTPHRGNARRVTKDLGVLHREVCWICLGFTTQRHATAAPTVLFYKPPLWAGFSTPRPRSRPYRNGRPSSPSLSSSLCFQSSSWALESGSDFLPEVWLPMTGCRSYPKYLLSSIPALQLHVSITSKVVYVSHQWF